MSKFKTSLALFLAGLPILSSKADSLLPADISQPASQDPDPVSLRPLNFPGDNLFAGHRSHSSHRSHASHSSHYSGSSGGSSYTPSSSPHYSAPVSPSYESAPSTNKTTNPGKSGFSSESSGSGEVSEPTLSLAEKKKLQVMRVQIALTRVGLFSGRVSGFLDDETKESLKLFQKVKGLHETGLMTTDTLNALGVPSVK